MDKKKKIIAVISCVIVIASIICISCFADNSEYYGLTIENGTTVVFKDYVTLPYTPTSNIEPTINFSSNGLTFTRMRFMTNNSVQYASGSGTSATYKTAFGSTGLYSQIEYKTIVLNQDFTLGDNYLSNFIISNALSGLPEPPPPPPPNPIPDAISNVQETFSFTLTAGTLIISWLVANQIALAGLYLYILISLIAVMKRFFVT